MLHSVKELQACSIRATDGEIGSVSHFLFDDVTWSVRYLVVDTGNWMGDRKVLIVPDAIAGIDWSDHSPLGFDWAGCQLHVNLTRDQIKHSPDIDTARPVSRQQEEAYHRYFGWEPYWYGPDPFGGGVYPVYMPSMAGPPVDMHEEQVESVTRKSKADNDDVHLRSTAEVSNYHIQATDGEIGHVENFILDDHPWAIRYLVVATRNWWPGKKVLLSPHWVSDISWEDRKVHVSLTRDAIQNSPEFDPTRPLDRDYEQRLHQHYGQPGYWEQLAAREAKH